MLFKLKVQGKDDWYIRSTYECEQYNPRHVPATFGKVQIFPHCVRIEKVQQGYQPRWQPLVAWVK